MPSSQQSIALGLDIGGTRIKSVAVDHRYQILSQHKLDSQAKNGPRAVRKAIGETIAHYKLNGIAFSSIGIGCAGSVEPKTGIVRNSPNFADWSNVDLKTEIERDFGVTTTVENDANCAAYSEWKMGRGRGHDNLVLLTLGTGIGGGFILNGNLYRGSTGTGGELGHLSIYANGVPCPCGNRGCFERYCSASSLMKSLPEYSAKEIFSRAAEQPFKSLISQFMADFSVGLTSIANVFDPSLILLGGGLSQGVSQYLDQLQTWVQKNAFPAVGANVSIAMTEHLNLSGALGAACIALEQSEC